ncbi:hypothetical protein AB0B66_20425 [Catellatospora sp. NPDC049111]|uniref:hypothetical protein n=1 Tax=Catellatospora sp. NPDC049111 TaxID=3155271 RepID=UPI0033D1B90A
MRTFVSVRSLAALAAGVALAVTGGLPASAAPAEEPTIVLRLDDAFAAKTAAQQNPALRGCAGIPGGSAQGVDGWVFNQPVPTTAKAVYLISYQSADLSEAYLLGVNDAGVTRLTPDGEPPVPATPPAGVAGGLIGPSGVGGVWLQTPSGWHLVEGLMRTYVAEAERTTFDLVKVCRVGEEQPPASPSASASPRPGSASPVPGTGGGLPVTGPQVWLLGGVGAALVVAGGLLLLVRRRRVNMDDSLAS